MFEMDGVVPGSPPQTESPLATLWLFGCPQEDFQEGAGIWATLTPMGRTGDALAVTRGRNCLFGITQEGKRKFLPLSQVDKPGDV